VIGTYSSIYVAAPILIWLDVGSDSFVQLASPGGAERVDRDPSAIDQA
jgi:preprotein translocase subunit SecF